MIRAFSFLQRHPKSSILYFRRRIPERYRCAFGGRHEFKRSLHTCDKQIAIPQAMVLAAMVQSKFSAFDKESGMGGDDGFIGKIEYGDLVIDYDGDVEKELSALAKAKEILQLESQKDSPTPQPTSPQVAQPAVGVESEKLSVVCRKYRAEKMQEGSWTAKIETEHESSHGLLIQFMRDVQIATITPAHARRFKEALLLSV